MNGTIFKILGVAILTFEVLLGLLHLRDLTRGQLRSSELDLFVGALLVVTTMIALDLIRLYRWAAIAGSALAITWSLMLATFFGTLPWRGAVVGVPIALGMFLPLYATIRNWDTLKPLDRVSLKTSSLFPRSSDRLHLE